MKCCLCQNYENAWEALGLGNGLSQCLCPFVSYNYSHTEPSETFDHEVLFLYLSVRVLGPNSDAGFILTGRNQSDCPFYVSRHEMHH